MDYNKFLQSKALRAAAAAIAIFIVLLVAFRAGMSVGFHKADFSCRWGGNYSQNFAGPRPMIRGGLEGREYLDPHGIIGQIIKIDNSAIVVRGNDGMEKIILIRPDTAIERFRDNISPSDLQINDMVIAIGEPNNIGQTEARLIRILPSSLAPEMGPRNPMPGQPGPNISSSSIK